VLQDKKNIPDNPENAQLVNKQLLSQYYQYQEVFSKTAAEVLPEYWSYDHKIILEEPLPNSYSLLYKQNIKELEATKQYIQEQLWNRWIEHSSSLFASLILCVRKLNSSLRICVDYYKLNNLTCKDAYLIPYIDKLLACPSKAKLFTKFDIWAAFNKICIDLALEEYTTFWTRYRTYKCKVLLFGLCNGLATY
jgi:hypothetical protein